MSEERPPKYCTHVNCRLDTAAELAYMGLTLKRRDLMLLAAEAEHSTVRCKLMPRKGPVHAPFPPTKGTKA